MRPWQAPARILALTLACLAGCDRPLATPTQPSITPAPTMATLITPTVVQSPSTSPTPRTAILTPAAASQSPLRVCIVTRARHYTHTNTHYRFGHSGPVYFDCTGFVYRVFVDCSATELIGAQGEQPVRAYYDWFVARGQADAVPPQIGDLVVYDLDSAHIAVYVGDGRAISALLEGVREHDAARLGSGTGGEAMPVKAYLHIQPR